MKGRAPSRRRASPAYAPAQPLRYTGLVMTATGLGSVAEDRPHEDRPREDHIVVLRRATWADFQRLQEIRGDHSAPRLAYLDGALEIMSPSQDHESLKSRIGRLVEVWCLERGVEFETLGSWTLENKQLDRGVEPDECYVFGNATGATRPDLPIEVVWTSGGINKLDVYRGLGVPEVWIWRRGVLTPHLLRDGQYEVTVTSECLPGIDLAQLVSFLDAPTTSAAIRAYRDALR